MSLANVQLQFTPIARDFTQPVSIAHAGDDRLFVVEKTGRIQIIQNGQRLGQPFLDISDRVRNEGEQGLLSVAFSPNYARNGEFYVNYINEEGNIVIARYQRSSDRNRADVSSEEIVMTIPHPRFGNHNGGQLAFGRDGFLYIATGDGGGGGDPDNNAQNPQSLLGKILRIDVESQDTYRVPTSNPFVGSRDPNDRTRDEIWASGLRNPWRFSFDRQTGDLYIGDVGQSELEEINFQPATSRGGENYGWRLFEGTRPFDNPTDRTAGLTPPITEYPHSIGSSVTGGYVYRGRSPDLQGVYLYGDFVTGVVLGLQRNGTTVTTRQLTDTDFNISTFGEDQAGNLYLADFSSGTIYRASDIDPPTQYGTARNDVLTGTNGRDRIAGMAGNDTITGLADDDRLIGGTGNDRLFGNGGRDILRGDAGDDRLIGGSDSDGLIGGAGRDIFQFQRLTGRDRITDFQVGQDRIGLGTDFRFQDLNILQQQNNTLIRSGNFSILLENVSARSLTGSSFTT